MIRLALCNLAGGSERRVRSRAPDILVDATFHAIADAGSIPAVSTTSFRCIDQRALGCAPAASAGFSRYLVMARPPVLYGPGSAGLLR